ncbi:hypothetical protein MLD38_037992 [Melastoma candidum]|uniref:Uncharacterized protein n=1 Tax=Melastoma candidum TaxID=119954 RepID=A0ACB9KY78_9MYRT|nr:hypothetical protein MLD38_037992 [Melastoma candidum]
MALPSSSPPPPPSSMPTNISSYKSLLLSFIFLLVLCPHGCGAARILRPMPAASRVTYQVISMTTDGHNQHKTSFRYGGHVFAFLPKGSTVPPSGPSPRHDSAIASAPKD